MPTCPTCSTGFEISEADLTLLQKLSPEVAGVCYDFSPPTECPSCRQQRRMSFRNERKLYERTCDITGKKIVSVHAPDSPFKVCDKDVWYSDDFDPLQYGRDYDPERPFFEQFSQLLHDIPLPSLRVEMSENCAYNNDMRDCRNCYLCARTHLSQDLLYCYRGNKSSDSVDCMQVTGCELCYECVECVQCHSSRFLFFCSDCTESAFLLDCRNCMNCFMCTNLRNKQYCFQNEQLSKEEYEKRLSQFHFGSAGMVERAWQMYSDIQKQAIRRDLMLQNCEDCTGDNLFDCQGCVGSFGAQGSQGGRYLYDVKLYRDSMDAYSGGRDSELIYQSTAAAASYAVRFCVRTSECNDCLYSFFLNSCKNCFGCVGLKRSRFCILNKEYSETEYEELVRKIIERMRNTPLEESGQGPGPENISDPNSDPNPIMEWGQFFPPSCSPFPYNDTVAQEYYPLTNSQIEERGYRYRSKDPKEYQPQSYTLPDNTKDVSDDILDATLACTQCSKNYKIVKRELQFYRDHSIAIPCLCLDCRHMRRLSQKNHPTLRTDTCRSCSREITTSYPQDSPMQILCEECYQKALY